MRISDGSSDGCSSDLLSMIVEPGGYRRFGRVVLRNDDIFSARHIQRIARFDPGDPYQTSEVTDLRRALIATGLISSVTLTPQDAGDGKTVDLNVALERAPPRTVAGEVGYGTGERKSTRLNSIH